MPKKISFLFCILFLMASSMAVGASEKSGEASAAPAQIAVEDVTEDEKIGKRLREILTAIGSYSDVKVKVLSGVVILSGQADNSEQIKWVEHLAGRLDGVVAVKNQISTKQRNILDFSPARDEVDRLKVIVMRHLPVISLSVIVAILSFFIFVFSARGMRKVLTNRISSRLLTAALAKILSIPVLLLGLYIALRISGLAGLAFTLLGGTGLFGVALGLGLKNGLEDYIAGIILSIKKPFRADDWVQVGGYEGIVQNLTSRSTLIMDFSGNHVLIPNGFVYKSIIINKTANPKMRGEFVVGIDYSDSIESAQQAILNFLKQSQVVLKDPEPWVHVDKLAGSTVDLKVYFWINVKEVSFFKVSSHLMREVKKLLLADGFSLPDPNRELIFMNRLAIGKGDSPAKSAAEAEPVKLSVSEEDTQSEASELSRLHDESDLPDQGENILK